MKELISDIAFSIYEFVYPLIGVSFLIVVFVLIPLSLFKKTRRFSSNTLFLISYIVGFVLWIYSVGISFTLLGWFWLIIGILLAGLGVVLVAFVGSIILGYGDISIGIAVLTIFVIFVRLFASYLADR